MASGRITGAWQAGGGRRLVIDWAQTGNTDGTSTVSMTFYVEMIKDNWTGGKERVEVNTVTMAGVTGTWAAAAWDQRVGQATKYRLGTTSLRVPHDPDGTLTTTLSAVYNIQFLSYATLTASGSVTLDKIVMGSSIASVTGAVDAGGTLNIVMNRLNTAYRHRAVVEFGGRSLTTEPYGDSVSVGIPLEWLEEIPDAASGTATVRVTTYTDESCTTAVGQVQTAEFTIRAGSSARPVIAAGALTASPVQTGAAAGFRAYIQGKSRVRIELDASQLTLVAGATVMSYSAGMGGSFVGSSYTSDVLTAAGDLTVTYTVTDSRGLTGSGSVQIRVESYAPPRLTNVSIYRASGAEADQAGTDLYVKATLAYSAVAGENSADLYGGYLSGSTWVEEALESGAGEAIAGVLDVAKSYRARVRAVDALGGEALVEAVIPTAGVSMHFRDGGVGVRFGGYAEDGNFTVDWPAVFKGNVQVLGTLTAEGGAVGGDEVTAESIGAVKKTGDTMTGPLGVPYLTVGASLWPYVEFRTGDATVVGDITVDGNANDRYYTISTINRDQDNNDIKYRSRYGLPGADPGLTADAWYYIHTTKDVRFAFGSGNISGDLELTIDYSSAGFTEIPVVIMNYSSSDNGWVGSNGSLKVYNKTTTGAKAIVGGSYPTVRAVDWIAIGK